MFKKTKIYKTFYFKNQFLLIKSFRLRKKFKKKY